MKIVLGITGGYGAPLTQLLIDALIDNHELLVVANQNGSKAFKQECRLELYDFLRKRTGGVRLGEDDLFSPIAQQVLSADKMVILPCSMGTVGSITMGMCDSLITKAADNMLKTRKQLILGIGEAPMSAVSLANLQKLMLLGATVYPLVPDYSLVTESVEQLKASVIGRITDILSIK
ncbi:MAG: hypothetical protein J6Q67_06550 [Clostridia bacterium]|nr:hypothetical protein [Clostridia bacterium]